MNDAIKRLCMVDSTPIPARSERAGVHSRAWNHFRLIMEIFLGLSRLVWIIMTLSAMVRHRADRGELEEAWRRLQKHFPGPHEVPECL